MHRLPLISALVSIIAHAAFLFAPDPNPVAIKLPLYLVASGGTLFVALGLLRSMRQRLSSDQRPWLRGELSARFSEVMIFVGVGYCTIVEPGVIKLGEVLPLGWSCAIAALWLELLGALALARGLDARQSWDESGFRRIFGIALFTAAQGVWDILGREGHAILTFGLALTLFALLADIAATAFHLLRALPPERD